METKSIHQNKAEQMRFLIKMILASFLFRKCQEPLRRETTKSSSIEFIGLDATAQAKWLHSLIHKCFFFFFIKDLLLLLIFPEQRIFRKKRAFMCKFCEVRDVNKICK